MEFVNLTGKDLIFCDKDNKIIKTIPASSKVARAVFKTNNECGEFDGVDIYNSNILDYIEGLPESSESTVYYIVNNELARYISNRRDVFVPNNNKVIKIGEITAYQGMRFVCC
jgi:hypothetical protein